MGEVTTMTSSHRTEATQSTRVVYSRAATWIDSNGGYPFMILLASLVVIIAASVDCNNSCNGTGVALALALGAISFLIAFMYLFVYQNWSLDNSCLLATTFGFFLLWAILAGYGTFEGPFVVPGNGYFACWFGFFASTGMVVQNVHMAREASQRFLNQGTAVCLLIVGSIVVMAAGLFTFNGNGTESIIAIVGGAVSLLIMLIYVFMFNSLAGNSAMNIAHFLIIWWLVMSLILTFSIFRAVGNGFFGCWGSLIASFMLARYI